MTSQVCPCQPIFWLGVLMKLSHSSHLPTIKLVEMRESVKLPAGSWEKEPDNLYRYINEFHNSYITSVENQEITVKPVNPHSWPSRWTTPLPSAATAPPGRSRRGLRLGASGNRGQCGRRRGRRLGRCWRPRKRIDSSRAPLLKPCWTWGKRPWHQRRHCWSWRCLDL